MKPSALAVLLALLVALWLPGALFAEGPYDRQMREIASLLQCPICKGQSVLDSNSQLATQMRQLILEKLEAGESKAAIIQYMVDRYGEGILLDPPKRGFTLGIWLGPVVVVVLGLAIVAGTLRGRLRHRPEGGVGAEETAGPELAQYPEWFQEELAQRAPLGPTSKARQDGGPEEARGNVG